MLSFRKILLLLGVLALNPGWALAAEVSTNDQNTRIRFIFDDPNPNAPVTSIQYPRGIEWIVDGRRILVYPSSPAIHLDVDHLHAGIHVAPNQLHAQGPYLKDARSYGAVTQGIVYTIEGGTPGSGTSRLVEKVDVTNKTANSLSIPVVGMGWRPQPEVQQNQVGMEIPNLSGLNVVGNTVAFIRGYLHTSYMQGNIPTDPQGHYLTGSITDPPFASVDVLPMASFNGFNTLNREVTLPAGATLTVITELKLVR